MLARNYSTELQLSAPGPVTAARQQVFVMITMTMTMTMKIIVGGDNVNVDVKCLFIILLIIYFDDGDDDDDDDDLKVQELDSNFVLVPFDNSPNSSELIVSTMSRFVFTMTIRDHVKVFAMSKDISWFQCNYDQDHDHRYI